MEHNYLVLIYDDAKQATIGSGVMATFNKKSYVITCKHVIWNVSSENLFAIPSPRDNMQFLTSKLLNLDEPLYHPADDANETYDIALCSIKNYQDVADLDNTFNSISLDLSDNYIEPIHGHHVLVRGFSTEHIKSQIGKIGDGIFSYEEMEGEVKKYAENIVIESGFTATLIETFFVKSEKNNSLGGGVSGGIVLLKDSGQLIPYGIIISIIEGEHQDKSGTFLEKLYGNTFVQFKRVIEVLQ